MKTHAFLLILISFSVLFFVGCKEDEQPAEPELKVTLDDPTNVTETSFTANWTVNKTNIQSCQVEISLQSDFTDIFKTVAVNDPLKTSQLIDGLHGATNYYHRIKVTLDDGTTSGVSDPKKVATSYQTESVNVTTIDGIRILPEIYFI